MKLNGSDVVEATQNLNLLSEEKLKTLLLPENMLKLGYAQSDLE